MKIIRWNDPDFSAQIATLDRRAQSSETVRATAAEIIGHIRTGGDEALLRLTARFGGPEFPGPAAFRVTTEDFAAAEKSLEPAARKALQISHANITAFARRSLRSDWEMTNPQGAVVGERFRPYERVGIYVPGGSAPLVSTALMTVALAQVAGCPEIVVTTPSDREGRIAPALLSALALAGATEVYRVGGAQAVAALALGTSTIRPVAKIFGPGNAYVVEAKRQLFGIVAIDLLPGPSEILVLADDSARPDWIAADLLAQAEHGADSAIMLITTSESLLVTVSIAVATQAALLPRKEQLSAVIERNARLVLTRDLNQAITLANLYAAEHVSVAFRDPRPIAERLTTAGAIFLGGISPVAAGDFLAGPSHTLPTGGGGKSFGGLTVDQFQRRMSVLRYDADSLRKSMETIEQFSRIEGLAAHGRSATIRFE
jgi:histidinol dehydrogenase